MYSCPSDDIHSIYIDNELPLSYVKEYEAHLKVCPKCAAKAESLKKVHSLLQEDKSSLEKDQAFLDQSYARLMTKMHYSKNTQPVRKIPAYSIMTGLAAAAAVLAAVIIPVRTTSAKNQAKSSVVANLVPVERPHTASFSNKNIVLNGNINDNLAHTVGTGTLKNTSLADVDVFRPDFQDANNELSIKFSVPGLEAESSQVMEVKMPVNTITGLLP
ncbi:MAG: zf-HC2 domain-containing protein [Treponema sp.]|nr:zf-HC2 domain-containing protein [Treponema sp.]